MLQMIWNLEEIFQNPPYPINHAKLFKNIMIKWQSKEIFLNLVFAVSFRYFGGVFLIIVI